MANRCEYIKDDGQQCGGFAVDGSVYCINHEPEMKETKLEAVRKGGASENHQYLDIKLCPLSIKRSSDVVEAVIQTINELREGKMSPKAASTIGYLLGIALKAFEQTDLTNRVQVIERVILERSTK
jgi:hypothetical protein